MKTYTTQRRSPRLVAAAQQTNKHHVDDDTPTHTQNNALAPPPLSSWNETNFDPYVATSSTGESTRRNESPASADFTRMSSTSDTQHGNDSPASSKHNGIASRTRSTDSTRARSNDIHKMVETRSSKLAASQTKNEEPLVSPASLDDDDDDNTTTAATTIEQQASLALAALCKQSDQRNGRKSQPVTEYIGHMTALPIKKKDVSFPASVHAMVTELSVTAPNVLQWLSDRSTFIVHQPKSPILVEALKKYFNHGNFSSLQRQLNIYGWTKHSWNGLMGIFYNPLFHRDCTTHEDFCRIKRRKGPRTTTKSVPAADIHQILVASFPPPSPLVRASTTPVSQKSSNGALVAVMYGYRVVSATITVDGMPFSPSTTEIGLSSTENEQDSLVNVEGTGQEASNSEDHEPIVVDTYVASSSPSSPCFAALVASPPPKQANNGETMVEESPFGLDGIQFDPLSLPVEDEDGRKMPALADDDDKENVARCLVLHDANVDPAHTSKNPLASPETTFPDSDRSPKRLRVTLYNGESLGTSQLNSSLAVHTFSSMAVDLNAAVGDQPKEEQRHPSPVKREAAPEDRVPPPRDSPVPSPLALKNCSSPSNDLTPFADVLSSALGLGQGDEQPLCWSLGLDDDSGEQEMVVTRDMFDRDEAVGCA